MTPEPLKGKIQTIHQYNYEEYKIKLDNIKSAVEGLIKFHEDRIEWWIEAIRDVDERNKILIDNMLVIIEMEYTSIMAIEHWLEDVI